MSRFGELLISIYTRCLCAYIKFLLSFLLVCVKFILCCAPLQYSTCLND